MLFLYEVKIIKRENVTKEEFINEIHKYFSMNGRTPRYSDFTGEWISCFWGKRLFGSWNKAIIAAGYEPNQRVVYSYSKEELIKQLQDYYNNFKKVPTQRSLKVHGYAGSKSFYNHFGSFKNALKEAGLLDLRKDKHQFCETYTDEEMLNSLRNYMKDKNRIPNHEEMSSSMVSPSVPSYDRRFGSIYKALKIIGYDKDIQKENDLIESNKEMLDKYIELAKILERTPSSRDIDQYSKQGFCSSMKTYESHFGSLFALQKQSGLTPTVVGRNKTKQEMLEDLTNLSKELGRTPSQNDLKYFEHVASLKKYINVFGSWNNAIEGSNLKPNNNIYHSNNGQKCLSYYELLFCNMLEYFKIPHTKEDPYKDHIDTDKKYRFDFVITYEDIKYFIEIFGIVSRSGYEETIKDKISLCKNGQLKLIEIYPEDFYSCSLNELYKMMTSKIRNLHT
ncbi:homing endonuclease associated repeat-containing protein [Halobacillus litoralis]|uniref:homing endonuclease associated repeat-containing protein n=1 Tax=Halobacillus litoralis TaxID=45668 RepID=UPI001CD202E2|nr:hypothetical protein [Halobacillus litoralis]MCA1021653.1 hypothetical protein [Halobacillus litoralis]